MRENKKEVKARKKAFRKAKHRAIRPWKGLSIVCAILAVIFVPLYSLLNVFDNSLAIFVGGTFWKLQNEDESAQYFTSDFESAEDMVDYGLQLVQQVEAEGAALLMNENNALPLAEGANVSLFSNSSVNLVYGGTGSGNIDASTADTLKTAMEKTGFNVNETLWNFYESEEMGMYKRGSGGTIATASAVVTEVPWNEYTDEVKDSVSSYGDAAIVTLSRVGGEGADLAYGDVNYLALDDNEKEMLSNVAAMKADGTVSKIIVLINSANALQVDFLKDNTYNVDACLWIGDVGITGINAVADILAGNVNPSGSLVDTYCYDNMSSPAMANFTPCGMAASASAEAPPESSRSPDTITSAQSGRTGRSAVCTIAVTTPKTTTNMQTSSAVCPDFLTLAVSADEKETDGTFSASWAVLSCIWPLFRTKMPSKREDATCTRYRRSPARLLPKTDGPTTPKRNAGPQMLQKRRSRFAVFRAMLPP